MDNEKILREILATTRETRDMVNSMNKQRRFANFIWAIKWIIIIFLLYGAYTAAQPYIDSATQTINSINNFGVQVNALKNTDPKSFTDFVTSQFKKSFVK